MFGVCRCEMEDALCKMLIPVLPSYPDNEAKHDEVRNCVIR